MKVTRRWPNGAGLDNKQITANVTNAAAFDVQFTISATAPTGRYNLVSQEAGAIPFTCMVNATSVAVMTVNVAKVSGGVSIAANPNGAPAGADPPATGTVHVGYVFGKSAFAVPAIGARVQATLTPATATDSDPLQQRRKAGFKFFTKTCILNVDFYRRFECMSAFN